MTKSLNILLILLFSLTGFAQDNLGIGEWRAHLPFNSTVSVTESEDHIYFATRASIFSLDKTDNTVIKYSKADGLTGYGISVIKYYDEQELIVVGYSNGNIDLFSETAVFNLPDIANKSMTGSKSINNITIQSDTVYLSCDFGVVVMDLEKKEIINTYLIGDEGSPTVISHLEIYNNEIYALTEDGLKHAHLNSLNLADYAFWTELEGSDTIAIKAISTWNDKLVASFDDTLKTFDGTSWRNLYADSSHVFVQDLFSNNGQLTILQRLSPAAQSGSNRRVVILNEAEEKSTIHFSSFSVPEKILTSENGQIYMADSHIGSYIIFEGGKTQIRPNGPSSEEAFDFYFADNTMYVAAGGVTSSWGFKFNSRRVYTFSGTDWWRINSDGLASTYDILRVIKDPVSGHLYFGSYGGGLIEYTGSEVVNMYKDSIYTYQNGAYVAAGTTTMKGTVGHESSYRITGLAYDEYNDLWIAGYGSSKPLTVKTANNQWYSYAPDISLGSNYVGKLLVDKADQKWMISPRGMGIVVFNDGGTLEVTSDDQWKLLNGSSTEGNLPSSDVYDIAIDDDGEIWVGTLDGLAVFYCPEIVFGDGCNAQKINIEKDGYIGYAFESKLVTAIEVDGANRKWIGTENGVYLMSEDGTQELLHFNEDNSPLLSNNIVDIGINHTTGEVFIATDRGIIGYKSTATKTEENTSFLIYPNPVRPDYNGDVAIRGLADNSDVKITDIGGNIVYHNISFGGQLVWDTLLPNGERVASGVYLVWASNSDGTETSVSKLVIMK